MGKRNFLSMIIEQKHCNQRKQKRQILWLPKLLCLSLCEFAATHPSTTTTRREENRRENMSIHKIKVDNPVVDLDGDEMTRYVLLLTEDLLFFHHWTDSILIYWSKILLNFDFLVFHWSQSDLEMDQGKGQASLFVLLIILIQFKFCIYQLLWCDTPPSLSPAVNFALFRYSDRVLRSGNWK